MYEKHFQGVLYIVLIVIVLEGDTRRPRLKEEKTSERRDYRPSKWVSNSAMDVWYGNKSMVDILFREFSDVMNRIAIRPVRSPLSIYDLPYSGNVTKLTTYTPEEETRTILLRRFNETITKAISMSSLYNTDENK